MGEFSGNSLQSLDILLDISLETLCCGNPLDQRALIKPVLQLERVGALFTNLESKRYFSHRVFHHTHLHVLMVVRELQNSPTQDYLKPSTNSCLAMPTPST